MAQAAGPLVSPRLDDGTLRGFADRIHFAATRRNGAAAFMDRSRLDNKAAAFQRKTKGLVSCGLLGINPDDEYPGGTQEVRQPVERDLKGFERASPPID